MKKYFKIFLAISLSVIITSCDDFLDTKPISSHMGDPLTTSELSSKYESVEEAEAELLGAYNIFKSDIYQFDILLYGDVQSDNCYAGGDGFAEADIDDIKVNSLNNTVRRMWGQYFELIGEATSVIENTRMLEEGIEEHERQKIMAEGKFIRAHGYLDAVRIWGDVPLLVDLIPTITAGSLDSIYSKLYPERTSKEVIYDLIKTDLTEAIPYLDSKSNGSDKASKGAAYGLLAMAHASEGTKETRDYQKVVDYCNHAINEGYSLVNDYEDLWKPTSEFTSESLFELNFTLTEGNWAYWVLYSEEDGSITWRRYATPTHEFLAKYENGDKRLESTVVFKSVPYETYYPADNYPIANKVRTKESNLILMRLADILLLKAEALTELGTASSIQEAMGIVNQIRSRAGLPALPTNMSQSEARLAVEKERQMELAIEGKRWFDLQRNERIIEVMTKHRDRDNKILYPTIPEFRYVWPIPQNERDSNPNLTQNEGY